MNQETAILEPEQAELEYEFNQLMATTLRLEYELQMVVSVQEQN